MSQRNVEIVRHTIEVANRGDLDAIDDLATADYEWHNAPGFPGGRVHRGREAVRAGSGVTLDTPIAYLHTLRDGRFARSIVFLHHEEALEAVGLRE